MREKNETYSIYSLRTCTHIKNMAHIAEFFIFFSGKKKWQQTWDENVCENKYFFL